MHTYTNPKRKSTTWAVLLLSGMLFLNLNTTTGSAAAATESLPKPAWTSSSLMLNEANTEKDVMIKDIYAVPSKNLVYVHSSQPVTKTSSKTTLDWQLDSLQALDAKTGQLKWSTIFHEKSGPYTTYSNSLYTSNGTAYVYMEYSDKSKKLYSFNTSGKTNWVKNVNASATVSLMDNENVLVATSQGVQANGSVRSKLSIYDKKGKLLTEKTINGSVLQAGHGRIVVDASKQVKSGNFWQPAANPKIEIYDSSLTRLSFYQFPADANTQGDGGGEALAILDDGSVLMRANFESTGNRLMGFGSDGKLAWGRTIAGDAYIQTIGNGYTVLTGPKLELYTMKGKVTERLFQDTQPVLMHVDRTQDGQYQLDFTKTGYILDPQTLEDVHVYTVSAAVPSLDRISTYMNDVIYSMKGEALSKYVLKSSSAK
ncbi:PQQ-binding-like beta-propeller repeat protein [Paenibacillus amylolyticus]|uniref:outer membrane protein assembly factor BamB family protein n=1 Tax=Paenibacillus amylolyticus TaxID=1451 RepID=UPI003EB751EC